MRKKIPSKLDPYAEQLVEMESATPPKTLAEMKKWLAGQNVSTSSRNVSAYLKNLRTARATERVLDMITTGSKQCREVDKAFAKNPAPKLGTLIKLFKTLIMQLSLNEAADPKLLSLANTLTTTVCRFITGQTQAKFKKRELALAENKFYFDATKACLAKLDTLKKIKTDSGLTEDEKIQQARVELFGEEAVL
jgi:DNA-binding phage protein